MFFDIYLFFWFYFLNLVFFKKYPLWTQPSGLAHVPHVIQFDLNPHDSTLLWEAGWRSWDHFDPTAFLPLKCRKDEKGGHRRSSLCWHVRYAALGTDMDAARKEVDVVASECPIRRYSQIWHVLTYRAYMGILAATKVMVCYEANGSFSGEPDVDVGATCSTCSDILIHCIYSHGITWVCCGSTWRFDVICWILI